MKIITARKASLPLLFVPAIFGPLSAIAADEQTLIVSATPQTVSELDTPAAVSVVSGEDMRHATPRINLSESLGSVPGLQIQNRQNYAQDLQLSVRGFGARSTFGVRGIRMYVDGIPATMPDGQGQTSNIDLNSIESVDVLRGPFSALYGNASGGVININTLIVALHINYAARMRRIFSLRGIRNGLVLGHFTLTGVHHHAEVVLFAQLTVVADPGLGLLNGFPRVVPIAAR